jgi:hypothetical protein
MWNNLQSSDEWQDLIGMTKGLGDTADTLLRLAPGNVGGQVGLRDVSRAVTGHDLDLTASNPEQAGGKVLETMAELMTGDELIKAVGLVPKIGTMGLEAAKAASASGRLSRIAPVVRLMEKYPAMAKVMANGLDTMARMGVLGTAQATGKGEDPGEALKTGAVTGLTGGLTDIGLGSIGAGINALRPVAGKIGEETVPTLSEAAKKVGAKPSRAMREAEAGALERTEAAQLSDWRAQNAGQTRAWREQNLAQSADWREQSATQEADWQQREDARQAWEEKQGGAAQTVGQQGVRSIAQKAAVTALDNVNASRYAVESVTPAERMLPAPAEPQEYKFNLEIPAQEGKPTGAYVPAAETPNQVTEPTRGGIEPSLIQYLTSARPGTMPILQAGLGQKGTVTMSLADAQLYMSRLDDFIGNTGEYASLPAKDSFSKLSVKDQSAVIGHRDLMQQQLDLYHSDLAARPNFAPVDSRGVAAKIDNMGEAADQVHAVVKPVYQKLDELSEGKFGRMREQQKRSIKQMYNAADEKAFANAQKSNAQATRGIQDIFDDNRTNIRPQEYTSAQQGYATEMRMREIHEAVEGSFNRSAPADIAEKLGQSRTIDGDKLTDNINRLIGKGTPEEANTRAAIEQVIGKDGLENYYRMGDLFSRGPLSEPIPKPPAIPKPEPPKPLTQSQTADNADGLLRGITKYLSKRAVATMLAHMTGMPWLAAAGTSGAEDLASRWVMHKLTTSPRAGVMLDYAVRHQVADKIAIPLIASSMGALKEQKDQDEETNIPK